MRKTYIPPKDPRGGHCRLYWDMLDSPAWKVLTPADQRVYTALRRGLRQSNNGDVCLTLKMANEHGIASSATLAKSLRALVAVGLVAVTRQGGSQRHGRRLPTLYRFTCEENYAFPKKGIEAQAATFEWRRVKSQEEGRALIALAEQVAAANAQLQKMKRIASKNEGVGAETSSDLEPWQVGQVQKLKRGQSEKTSQNVNADKDLCEFASEYA